MTEPETTDAPKKPEPIVADTPRCKSAADSFVAAVTDGLETSAARYRYFVHAYSFLTAKLGEFAEAAREERRAELVKAAVAKAQAKAKRAAAPVSQPEG